LLACLHYSSQGGLLEKLDLFFTEFSHELFVIADFAINSSYEYAKGRVL
jgi:hypothetical protein